MERFITRGIPVVVAGFLFYVYLGLGPTLLPIGTARSYAPPDDAQFRRDVLDSPVPTLVKFGAEWCGPCRQMEPELDALNVAMGGRLRVIRIDVDERGDLAQAYGVHGIPHLALFRDGDVVAEQVGYSDRESLGEWILANW